MRYYQSVLFVILFVFSLNGFTENVNGTEKAEFSAYLMVYTGRENKLCYAYSMDAIKWNPLNEEKAVFDEQVELHDPYIDRVNGKFHLVSTKGNNKTAIYHWESNDLIKWTGGSIDVVGSSKKIALAPEFVYSKSEKLFYVFWTSLNNDHNAIFYAKTKDWKDISKPEVYFDTGKDIMDMTIIKDRDKYFGFYKNGIIGDWEISTLATSTGLNPATAKFDTFKDIADQRLILPTQTRPTRSPQVVKLINENLWYIYLSPEYAPLEAWQTRDFKKYSKIIVYPPEGARLGSIIRITGEELTNLLEEYTKIKRIGEDNILRLEELDLSNMEQGWGNPGIKKTIINEPLTINGKVFKHGVGTHAVSRFTINLKGSALAFKAKVGVDSENPPDRNGKGSVDFRIYADKKKVYDSGVMKIDDDAKSVDVDLKGVQRLDLIVMDGGDDIGYDHADWADAYFVLDPETRAIPESLPRPPKDDKVILTPPTPSYPKINAPLVIGAGEHREFFYYIPITGERPLNIKVRGLPKGIKLDKGSGTLRGHTGDAGEYVLTIKASNSCGSDIKKITLKIGSGLALTPPMGWNSWNCWGKYVKEEDIKAAADAFVKTDLINHGWTYVVIDDAWEGVRDPETYILGINDKFSDMKALGDYIHSKGLRFGIYTDIGYNTCQGYEGTFGYEFIDAQTFADWGVDYVKDDFCYAFGMNAKDTYTLFGDALEATERDIVYSICTAGYAAAWTWAEEAGGNLWRTSGDIRDDWTSVYGRISGLHQEICDLAGPGHWNDPDMLVVGKVGWGRNLHETGLTPNQQYSHISLWSLLAAPLMIGCDLSQIDDFTLNLLTNDEVIAVNQDPLGKQGRLIIQENGFDIWVKELADGSKAVGIFNLSPKELDFDPDKELTLSWNKIGLSGSQSVRDLWKQEDLGVYKDFYKVTLPEYGVNMIKASPVNK